MDDARAATDTPLKLETDRRPTAASASTRASVASACSSASEAAEGEHGKSESRDGPCAIGAAPAPEATEEADARAAAAAAAAGGAASVVQEEGAALFARLSRLDSSVARDDYFLASDGWDVAGLTSDLQIYEQGA